MKIALIADTFPPLRTSGAVQLRDLSRELVRQGHTLTVMLPTPELSARWKLETWEGVDVLRLRAPRTKDIGYVRRTLAELFMPYAMLNNLRRSPFAGDRWDGVVWYAPSIFLGPVANALKTRSGCSSYLIIRDIFPEWAVDMGLMRRGLHYRFFKAVEQYQYSVADVIGVQTPGNAPYFAKWARAPGHRLEVLQNWLADPPRRPCSIEVAKTPLAGRRIFVYAGNMGVAQGMDVLLDLAARMVEKAEIGFLFVGRGSDAQRLARKAASLRLPNVVFWDEIAPEEIPGLYEQCDVGMVALDQRHRTHNIPGKFLTYMQAGLPVLASINPGNDLVSLIEANRVGSVSVDGSAATLVRLACALIEQIDERMSARCIALHRRLFSPDSAVAQIVGALGKVSAAAALSSSGEDKEADDLRASAPGAPELVRKTMSTAAVVEQ